LLKKIEEFNIKNSNIKTIHYGIIELLIETKGWKVEGQLRPGQLLLSFFSFFNPI